MDMETRELNHIQNIASREQEPVIGETESVFFFEYRPLTDDEIVRNGNRADPAAAINAGGQSARAGDTDSS